MAEEWLTLAELSERTGVTVEALRKRLARGRLESQRGNDGGVRVRVTAADLESLRPSVRTWTGRPSGVLEESPAIRALEATVDDLRRRLDGTTAEAADAARRAEAERSRLLDLVDAERARAVAAEAEREETRRRLTETEAALDAERRRGWLSKLLGRR